MRFGFDPDNELQDGADPIDVRDLDRPAPLRIDAYYCPACGQRSSTDGDICAACLAAANFDIGSSGPSSQAYKKDQTASGKLARGERLRYRCRGGVGATRSKRCPEARMGADSWSAGRVPDSEKLLGPEGAQRKSRVKASQAEIQAPGRWLILPPVRISHLSRRYSDALVQGQIALPD